MVWSSHRRDEGRRFGGVAYHDYRQKHFDEILEQDHPGCSFRIDAVGTHNALDRALSLLNDRRTIGIYGLDDWGQLSIDFCSSSRQVQLP
jgi:hypothetical protein